MPSLRPSRAHPVRAFVRGSTAGVTLAAFALAAAPRLARAQPEDPMPVPTPPARGEAADARLYFNAGARAYAAGKYVPAIRAFEEAYRIEPRPGLVFSIAQAYRRQYFIDK